MNKKENIENRIVNFIHYYFSKSLLWFVIGFSFFHSSLQAQTTNYGDLNSWGLILTRLSLNEHWIITNELHGRSRSFLEDPALIIVRPSIDYAVNENVELSLGYSYLRNWTSFPSDVRVGSNENNMWEQLLLKQLVGKVLIQSRFRQEHRFVEGLSVAPNGDITRGGINRSNRFRYRLTLTRDILRMDQQSIFVNIFDEIWINQNGLIPADFSRNWLYLGLGYKFNSVYNVQLAYVHQYDKTGENTYMSSPVLQLSFFAHFKLRD